MTKPKWLIEHVFDEDCANLIKSLEETGTEYKIVSSIYDGDWKCYDDKDCVVTYGSIMFGNLIQREAKWVPGHYCNDAMYKCSFYYQHFKNLLNENHFYLPYSELLLKKEFIYDTMGVDDVVFIRPDSGKKSFTGKAVYREHFEKDIELFSLYDIDSDAMCLISTPKNIVEEWRFFVVDGKIMCGSSYKKSRHSVNCLDFFSIDNEDDAQAYLMAGFILGESDWEPDRAWCVDICKTKSGAYYLLEIGSFGSAGLYACNTTPLVKEINRIALEEWKEYYV